MAVTSLRPDRASGRQAPLLAVLDDGRQAFAILAALLFVSVALQFAVPMNHDAAWYLHSAKAFLDGGELYNDIYLEMNLPLPLVLAVPPVAFSEATGIFVVHAFRLYVFSWVLFSCWLTWRLLDGLVSAIMRRGLMVFILGSVSLLPMDHFGQREHLLIIAILPYLILIARRAEGLPLNPGGATLIGIQAALGFVLKPHFLLVPAALEAFLLWRSRNPMKALRPETLSLGLAVLAYSIAVVLYTPEFFTLIVPMAVDLYDGYKSKPWWAILVVIPTPITALALFIYLKSRHAVARRILPDILCLTVVCHYAIYLVQLKGWRYHLYPTVACLIIFLAVIVLLQRNSIKPDKDKPGRETSMTKSAIAASLVLFGSACVYGYLAFDDQRTYLKHMVPTLQRQAENSTFIFLTTTLSASFPLTHYSGVKSVSRFPMHWPIGDLMRFRQHLSEHIGDEERKRLEAHERYFIDALVTDFVRHRPKVVIVDEIPDKKFFTDIDLDFVEYFSADPRFAKLWSEYEVVDRLGYFTIFARR